MKKVAHYISSFLPITENWIYNQIIYTSEYKPVVYTFKRENKEAYPLQDVYSLQDDLNGLAVFFNKVYNKLFRMYPYYYNNIRKESPAIIHAHFGPSGYNMLKIKEKLGIPLITTFYGYDVSKLPNCDSWMEKYKVLFTNGELFLAEGPYLKKCLIELGCPEEKIIVQHLGVNLEELEFKPRFIEKEECIKILIAASFREKKGIQYALKAFKIANERHKNIKLTLIGDGELRKEIEEAIRELKILEDVNLLGYQPYTVFLDKLMNSHIFMLPSVTATDGDTEGGAPVALIDAQATGIPVLSTFHADIPEVVRDGETGLLVPERDETALAEKLIYLLDNPQKWFEIGSKGRRHVESEFDAKIQGKKLERIYQRVIQSREHE